MFKSHKVIHNILGNRTIKRDCKSRNRSIQDIINKTANKGKDAVKYAAESNKKWGHMGSLNKAYAQTLFGINNEKEWEEYKKDK